MPQLNRSQSIPPYCPGERIGRDDRIGTRDILYPKQRRYQAALHPFQLVYSVIVENPFPVFQIVFFFSIDIKLFLPFLFFLMISDDQDNSRETLSFHRSLLTKQIAFPIDLSPGLDLF